MTKESLAAGRGWQWFGEAWKVFSRNPSVWILYAVIYALVALLLHWAPGVGQLAATVLDPILAAGLYLAADRSARGKSIQISTLFSGFRHEKVGTLVVAVVFCLLFAFGLFLVTCVFGFVLFLSDYKEVMGLFEHPEAFLQPEHIGVLLRGAATLVFGMLVFLPLGLASWFAPLYILFDGEDAIPALKKSFGVFIRHPGPMMIYGLALLVWGLVALIPLGLGLLVYVPVSHIAKYLAYRELAGEK